MSRDKRRRNTRVNFHTTVDLTVQGRTFRDCETSDLSLKGISLPGISTPPVGTDCSVRLCLGGTSSSVCLSMEGQVVRNDGSGLAVNFTSMDPDSFFHLRNIVYYNAEDADDLEEFPFGQEE